MRKVEILVPFFIAGFGTCFTGLILDHVQNWDVYTSVGELFILLPAVLGLKGNLQMTLASRISTHSHLGHIQTSEDLLRLTCANLALNQCLSTVISFCASLLSIGIHLLATNDDFNLTNSLLTLSTALLTSSVTSFVLDILMIMVIQVAAQYSINPDNIATPIAASLGDICALFICSCVARALFVMRETPIFYWCTGLTITFHIILVPMWVKISSENIYTSNILNQPSHWYPLLTAMTISSLSGIILKSAVIRTKDVALFQPVICGVGGNLVAVQASRLATLLHREQQLGVLPDGETICFNPCNLVVKSSPGYIISRFLILIVVPGQLVFCYFCVYMNTQTLDVAFPFLGLYLLAAQIDVIILIYLAYVLTYALWSSGENPDNCTIPYLTSISDVLGSFLITLVCLAAVPNVKDGDPYYSIFEGLGSRLGKLNV